MNTRSNTLPSGARPGYLTLEKLPDATENIAALAKAWVDGEIDLSKIPGPAAQPAANPVMKGFAWAGVGALVTLGGIWAAGQF